ncbi:MAG: EamA family transporter [Bacteroidetes bacterium]|nr:EamA family transporter [Bacteroidota bacterium]
MNWFLLAFASAVFSAAASITEKKALFGMRALDFSVLLAVLNGVLALPLFLLVDFGAVSGEALLVLGAKNLLGSLAFLCMMMAIRNLELSGALPMMVLTPGLVALFAFLFLGESLSGMELGGMGLLMAGTYVLEMKAGDALAPLRIFWTSRSHWPIAAALLLFTITSVLDRLLLTDLQLRPLPMMAFQQLFTAGYFILFALVAGRGAVTLRTASHGHGRWILLVAVLTFGYRFAQIEATAVAPVALVLAVKRLSVFIGAMVGGRLFNESHLLRKAVAIAILLAGALMIVGIG